MTTNHHDPIQTSDPVNASTVNTPLGQLDEAITNIEGGGGFVDFDITDGVTTETVESENVVTFTGEEGINQTVSATDTLTTKLNFGGLTTETPVAADDIIAFLDDTDAIHKKATIQSVLDLIVGGSGGLIPIADVTLGSAAASISFTSIPGTYAHLMIVGQLRSDRASNPNDGIEIIFNSDTTATNYAWIRTDILGSTGASRATFDVSDGAINPTECVTAATATAGHFTPIEISIENYASATLMRHLLARYWHINNTTAPVIGQFGGIWKNTANAITQIDISPLAGSNFIAGSRLTLYGMADA